MGEISESHHGWLARVGDGLPPPETDPIDWTLSIFCNPENHPSSPRLDLQETGTSPWVTVEHRQDLSGIILRHPWCSRRSSEDTQQDPWDRYLSVGLTALGEARGEATMILWDRRDQSLVVARAPGSLNPIYFAHSDGALWISDSISTLIRTAGVPSVPSRETVAGYLASVWPEPDSTYFEAIRRVPPTKALTWKRGRLGLETYWNPFPDPGSIGWIGSDAPNQFGDLFESVVRRSLGDQPAGIFLSGGLDSVSVAAMVKDLRQRSQGPDPLALSLIFPDPDCDEELAQRAIANQLGLDQIILGFEETLDGRTPMRAALDLTAKRPFPLLNFWQPAYLELARQAANRGCRFILTGNGGDEWLTVSPLLAADLWREFRVLDLSRFWNSLRRSYRLSNSRMTYNLLWAFGIRPLVTDSLKTRIERRAPERLRALQLRRAKKGWQPWLRTDSEIFDTLADRAIATGRKDRLRSQRDGYYLREMRTGLKHFLVSQELEEIALLGRETGTLVRQPYMDPDLISFLTRVHPEVLSWKGRSKGLIRETVSRRFPNLGFQSQRKIHSTGYYRRSLLRDLDDTWRSMGETTVLNQLAVVDDAGVKSLAKEIAEGCRDHQKVHNLWAIINLETWARSWM